MTQDHDSLDQQAIESRWRTRWRADRVWEVDVEVLSGDEKFYNLVEFPYPSAEGLHVGHAYTYCGADTIGRYLRMRGKKVFQPIGFDSFGIHTENFALRTGKHPKSLTARTIATYRRQLDHMGIAWNWSHEVVTSDPDYYRWTQWIFLKLYGAGLAVHKEASVVWCPSCLTVLAHEQLEGERCERCHTLVTERVMMQWFLRITAYAEPCWTAWMISGGPRWQNSCNETGSGDPLASTSTFECRNETWCSRHSRLVPTPYSESRT
jgi:leucyl-tRNA synthetase